MVKQFAPPSLEAKKDELTTHAANAQYGAELRTKLQAKAIGPSTYRLTMTSLGSLIVNVVPFSPLSR